jgi:hypothetical protein
MHLKVRRCRLDPIGVPVEKPHAKRLLELRSKSISSMRPALRTEVGGLYKLSWPVHFASGSGRSWKCTAIGLAEIVPNVNIGRHTHPGPESGYMLEGKMVAGARPA